MQKWDYCALSGVGNLSGNFATHYPGMWFFTALEGAKAIEVSGRGEEVVVARTIAKLGLDGWELVGVSPGYSGWATLFFKRPIP